MIVYLVWAGLYDHDDNPEHSLKFITTNLGQAIKYGEALALQAWDWTKITTDEVEL